MNLTLDLLQIALNLAVIALVVWSLFKGRK